MTTKDKILDVLAVGAIVILGAACLLALAILLVGVPAFIVTWAWNFLAPKLWPEAFQLIWWQTAIVLAALGIVVRRLRGERVHLKGDKKE